MVYDKAKEMTQSRDSVEVFLVLGEALAKNCRFHSIKLAFFDESKGPHHPVPREMFELHFSDFESFLDRNEALKNKSLLKSEPFPGDLKLFETLFHEGCSIETGGGDGPAVWAHPVLIDGRKVFAALVIVGLEAADHALVSILMGSFISDMQRLKLYERVETLAITDGLTGIYVRRHLMERLEGEIDRCKRFGLKLSFLMIDVDHFKHFNDDYGHLVGDVILKQVAGTIKKGTREVDLVGRYGGEEFGVLLIETDEQGALQVAERIRRAVSEKPFSAYDERLSVTISVGSATFSPALNEPGLLIEAADSALYQAKRQGRDRVCLSGFTTEKSK